MYFPSTRIMMNEKGIDDSQIDFYIQICANLGKFGISGSFALIYNYTAEMYPVVVR